jgi:hypothetical protein
VQLVERLHPFDVSGQVGNEALDRRREARGQFLETLLGSVRRAALPLLDARCARVRIDEVLPPTLEGASVGQCDEPWEVAAQVGVDAFSYDVCSCW